MMGPTHSLSGTAAGLAAAPLLVDDFLSRVVVVGVCTASALLPDIDSASSTVTRSLGPVTRFISWAIRLLTSHRGCTHSVLGITAWCVLLITLGVPEWVSIASALGCLIHVAGDACTTGGVRPLWPARWKLRLTSMKAGGAVEKYIVTPLLFILCGWFTLQLVW